MATGVTIGHRGFPACARIINRSIMHRITAVSIAFLASVIFIISSAMVSGQTYRPEVVFHGHDGAVVSVAIADTAYKKAVGLMDRKFLPADQGMLFVFYGDQPREFWMKDTYIPLDQVYIDNDGMIVDINKDATPLDTSMYTSRPCRYVVEVNGGYCDRHGIDIGDKVSIID